VEFYMTVIDDTQEQNYKLHVQLKRKCTINLFTVKVKFKFRHS